MISVSNLKVRFGEKVLFENTSLQLDPGKRYGLVGANGSGKSTFLRMLTGEEPAGEGQVIIPSGVRTGFLRQDQFQYDQMRVVDAVISGDEVLFKALERKKELLEHPDADGEELGKLEELISAHHGYSAEAEACRLLDGLGIDPGKHYAQVNSLSGGFKLRVLLARILFAKPDVLLLDEPTNHLDILSIAWLEDYLVSKFNGLLVVISHDRHFINRVSTHILDVDYRKVTLYTGNYDDFIAAKVLAVEQRMKENASLEKKVEQLQSFVDRFGAKATKARQAQSRARQIEKIEIPEVVESSRRFPNIKFVQKRPSGETVLQVNNVFKSFGDKKVIHDLSLEVQRGQKIAVIGPNGAGKSTFVKILIGKLQPDSGEVKWGYETHPSYFAQDHKEVFTEKVSAFDWLFSHYEGADITKTRSLLGSVLLSDSEQDKPVTALSGGEAARLYMAKIMAEKPNVLLLDEPTNHLDLESISVLEDAIREFEGTAIVVSHDKDFVAGIADTILEINYDGARIFRGSYGEYLENLGHDYLERGQKVQSASGKNKQASGHQAAFQERKEKQKELNRLEKQLVKLEGEVAKTEEEISLLDKLFADPDLYTEKKPEEIDGLHKQKDNLESDLENRMTEWEKLQEGMESLKAELEELNQVLGA